jgi:tetratricopeptide (TPR) repeat protein
MARHIRLIGGRRVGRREWISENLGTVLTARCHRRLRGPYTGVDTVLAAVLPDAARRWPDLVEEHRLELLHGMPELQAIIGAAPHSLAEDSSYVERTRWYSAEMVRCMSQGIVTFLTTHARRMQAAGEPLPAVVFEEVHAAEHTTQEFIALLMRRSDPSTLRLVISGIDQALLAELEDELAAGADRVTAAAWPAAAPGAAAGPGQSQQELVAAYVGGHGTSDDPAEIGAYERADPALRAWLHDEQADLLEASAGPSLRVGAVSYHREHGSDPSGIGSQTLEAALRYCFEVGFAHAVLDLGLRGRAVTDPRFQLKRWCDFTSAVANSMVTLRQLDQALALYLELRGRCTLPKVHMTTSYAIAMLYTRFFLPRDHDTAVHWENNAAAIASILPDPRERLVYSVFQDNALALIEMHRGNLHRALELVENGMAKLDGELGDDEWILHRSQLLYNKGRLNAALGNTAVAYDIFTTLVEMDPYYTDYLSERAKISRLTGDFAAALADYDRAAHLAPPFPELYYNRGTAKAALGDVEGALADFGYVLDMEPREVDTRLSRIELTFEAGDLDAAMADVRAGLALSPDEARLLCMQGTIHLERGEIPAAIEALDASAALDPDYPAALLNRAVACYRFGQVQRSVDDLTRVLAIVGDDPDILLNRGVAYRDLGQVELALADFGRALDLPQADLEELHRERGLCLTPDGTRAPAAAVR